MSIRVFSVNLSNATNFCNVNNNGNANANNAGNANGLAPDFVRRTTCRFFEPMRPTQKGENILPGNRRNAALTRLGVDASCMGPGYVLPAFHIHDAMQPGNTYPVRGGCARHFLFQARSA